MKVGDIQMARPSKSVSANKRNLTKEEKAIREDGEKKLKGKDDCIKPSSYLTTAQKTIFNNIVEQLKQSNVLGNIDIYVLDEAAIAIDRKRKIEKDINDNKIDLLDSKVISAKSQIHKEFCRYMNELCLSPQSRSKFANAAIQKKEVSPLLEALKDDDD